MKTQASAFAKFASFGPNMLGYAIVVVSVAVGSHWSAYPTVEAICAVVGIPAAVATLVTTIAKATRVMDDGWGDVIGERPECRRCKSLADDNRQLTEALATLRLPEERP